MVRSPAMIPDESPETIGLMVRIPRELHSAFDRRAEREGRTKRAICHRLIAAYVEQVVTWDELEAVEAEARGATP